MKTDLEYIGIPMPRWMRVGLRVKLKSTPFLRQHGMRGGRFNERDRWVHPGDLGTIERREHGSPPDRWDWYVQFDNLAESRLNAWTLEALVRVKPLAPQDDFYKAVQSARQFLAATMRHTPHFQDGSFECSLCALTGTLNCSPPLSPSEGKPPLWVLSGPISAMACTRGR